MSERWGDSRMDREALDRHLTDDPRDGYDYDDEGAAMAAEVEADDAIRRPEPTLEELDALAEDSTPDLPGFEVPA